MSNPLIYLKGRVLQREGDTQRSFIHWFPFQIAAMARSEPGQRQKQGAFPRSPTWVTRARTMDHLTLLSQARYQEAGREMRLLGLKPELTGIPTG